MLLAAKWPLTISNQEKEFTFSGHQRSHLECARGIVEPMEMLLGANYARYFVSPTCFIIFAPLEKHMHFWLCPKYNNIQRIGNEKGVWRLHFHIIGDTFWIECTYMDFFFFFFAAPGLCCFAWAFSSCSKQGLLFVVGSSQRWLLLLWSTGSRCTGSVVAAFRLSSCSTQASLFNGLWYLPGPGAKPVSPALAGRFLPTVPPAKSYMDLFFNA